MKDLGKTTYIWGIKIYRERSRRLIGLSQSTYLDKVLKKFKMVQSKKEFLPVLQGVKLSKTQNPTTAEDRERMKVIPYDSAIGYIKYPMLRTRPIVCLAMSLARGYNSDLGVDHWAAVKIILRYLRGLRKCFSVMEVTKRFVVKGYIDASFDTDPDDSKSQSGYILKVGAIS